MLSWCRVARQVDVVEAQAAELADRMGAVRDFKDAEAAHTAFLDACCAQCFLDMRALAAALEGTYALCLRVCALIQVRQQLLVLLSWAAPSPSASIHLTAACHCDHTERHSASATPPPRDAS